MSRPSTIIVWGVAWLLGGALPGGHAAAQTAGDLVGSWKVTSVTVEQGGATVEPYGSAPKGVLMLDPNGRYALVLLRPDLAPFASNNRTAGTSEENRAVVQGSIAHFGTYTVEEDGTLLFRVEASTFPNWDGAEQKRPFTLTDDTLEYTVSEASGGGTARVVWMRTE